MLGSIREVNEEFFKQFKGVRVSVRGNEIDIPIRYAKKSSRDYAEESSQQIYPCIAIQDHSPRIKEEWYIDMKSYFGGVSSDGLKGYLYRRPIWMEFPYDVSIVTKGYYEYISLRDYFLSRFTANTCMLFKQRLTGEDAVGDVVPYVIKETDIPRTDGIFETNYEFTCSVWVTPITPEEVDIIQKVILNGSASD